MSFKSIILGGNGDSSELRMYSEKIREKEAEFEMHADRGRRIATQNAHSSLLPLSLPCRGKVAEHGTGLWYIDAEVAPIASWGAG